jgi:hypothetical protein
LLLSVCFLVIAIPIDYVLNGKKDDKILISEKYLKDIPVLSKTVFKKSDEKTYVVNRDT